MVYVFCQKPSNAATNLAEAFGGKRLRKWDGMDFWRKGERHFLSEGDVVVCWGSPLPPIPGVRVLNAAESFSKKSLFSILSNRGVRTIPFYARKPYDVDRCLKRTEGGNWREMLTPPTNTDYWSQKYEMAVEYRVHSFDGRAIRCGVKKPREGFEIARTDALFVEGENAHPWIRTWDAGWTVDYSPTDVLPKGLKEFAHKTIKALKLTFGAIDVGLETYGSQYRYVISVDLSPALDAGSLASYTRAIQRWITSPQLEEQEEIDPLPEPWVDPLEALEARRRRNSPPAPPVPVFRSNPLGEAASWRSGVIEPLRIPEPVAYRAEFIQEDE